MVTIKVLLMILAIVCLFLAAVDVKIPRGNLLAGGLCLWAVATIVTA
jgi:hypothetical protein